MSLIVKEVLEIRKLIIEIVWDYVFWVFIII